MKSALYFKHLCAGFVVLLLLPVTGLAQQTATETRAAPPSFEAEKQARPAPRLKYRKGPVCMCNRGMSEAEIQAAMKKSQAK
ncbi:MAG: hypothetical protein OQL06_00675 [Gammaproteobacteria bacterium]|nr:hypothetical protein [Gammaproteobacteria bacterium]